MKRQNVDRARELRQNQTDAERKPWHQLRSRRLSGHKFRRQHEIDHYIFDFVCTDIMLTIELDGGQHAEQQGCDERRTRDLQAKGYRVLRFWNNDALTKMASVLEVILAPFASPSPHPSPLPTGERGKFAAEK
jgi:very-short-patch-repair endonuclease